MSALPSLVCLDVPVCYTRASKGQPVLTWSLGFLHSLAQPPCLYPRARVDPERNLAQDLPQSPELLQGSLALMPEGIPG